MEKFCLPENPIGGGFKVSAGQHWAWDKGSIAGARAVLEHAVVEYSRILYDSSGNEVQAIPAHHLTKMLKELEECR